MSRKASQIIIVYLLLTNLVLAQASVYDYAQFMYTKDDKTKNNPFMDGHFDEIIRFDKITLNSSSKLTTNEGKKIINDIFQKVTDYLQESKKIKLSVIGHSSLDELDETKNIKLSKEHALNIQMLLKDKGIDQSIITIDYRGSKDKLFTPYTREERVMVSMYVNLPRDLDGDGVDRSRDLCPNTQKGHKVSENGCKVSTLVVLLDGKKKNTSITVSTDKGSVLVDIPNQFISLLSKDVKPSSAQSLSEAELNEIIGDTLSNANKEQVSFTLLFEGMKLLNQEQVQEILDAIAQRDTPYIKIIGHTDTIGSTADNLKVGLKRAKILEQLIIDANIDYLKIDTDSYSESNLAIPTEDNVFEVLNRRVEVFIH